MAPPRPAESRTPGVGSVLRVSMSLPCDFDIVSSWKIAVLGLQFCTYLEKFDQFMRRGKDQVSYNRFKGVKKSSYQKKNPVIFEKNYFLQKVIGTVRLEI